VSALRPLGPASVSCLGSTCGMCLSASSLAQPLRIS
jgi:hypothetical protein